MLILKNGYMLDPASGTEGYYDILIDTESGKIAKIVPQGALMKDRAGGVFVHNARDGVVSATEEGIKAGREFCTDMPEEIDLNGQIVAPGKGRLHVRGADGKHEARGGQSRYAGLCAG